MDTRIALYTALYPMFTTIGRATRMGTEKASHLAYLRMANRVSNSLHF
jgi:hypothetical protein